MKIRVLFVCLGNICRSPMAEAVFQNLVDDAGLSNDFSIDSAGTSNWHAGETAHRGTLRVLTDHDIIYSSRSRQLEPMDHSNSATYIVAMDQNNIYDIRNKFGDRQRMNRLLDFANNLEVRDVPDPYYSGNFEYVYQLVLAGCEGLLEHIREQEAI